MKSKLLPASLDLLSEADFAASLVWLGQDPAVAMFEDQSIFSENSVVDMLSADEQVKAKTIAEPSDRRHFVFRRCFQRCFLKTATHWPHALSSLDIIHSRDKPSFCTGFPQLSLSFSSSGNLAVAAASENSRIGIDVERVRQIENSLELAARFFHADEAAYLKSVPEKQRSMEFLTFWVIKEACLKAIGKGVVYGLDQFTIHRSKNVYHIVPPKEFGNSDNWRLEFPDPPSGHILGISHYTPVSSG
jgi:4'-phosphopantetheinyl transferase